MRNDMKLLCKSHCTVSES